MGIRSILFDLDDTLVIESASADAAFLAACEHAHKKHGIDPEARHQTVRSHAGELWRASATITTAVLSVSAHGKVCGHVPSIATQI